jgi:ferredoxin
MEAGPVLMLRAIESLALRVLTAADAVANRWYGWRYNPLYQSGTIAVALYVTLVVTGLWLILFYRVGSPWESVAWLTANPWIGNWVRGLHRYATDAAVVVTVIHAGRMFAQARSWGARTLAWTSGVLLFLLLIACGWTGYVMVWDTFGEHLARDGARMIDSLPVLSEPISRAFTGERPVPSAVFFITLFAHIGIPLAMGVVFWLHIKRLARPTLLPPRPLLWTVIGLLTALAVVRPLVMAPKANPLVLPGAIPADLFVAFWLPFTDGMPGGAALGLVVLAMAIPLALPMFTARRGAAAPPPSTVDEEICTGCTQCSLDCPYGAIDMIPRTGRSPVVARVDPDLCVSCGICAGSCAPMGVGPSGRTGRDQIVHVNEFLAAATRRAGEIVVVCCEQGAGRFAPAVRGEGAVVFPVSCAGNLHTSVIELLIRGGSGGVLVLACPPRDCWNREGPRWLIERVYHEREAELQPRVPRERVRVAHAGAGEALAAIAELRDFTAAISRLETPAAERNPEPDTVCDPEEPAVRA